MLARQYDVDDVRRIVEGCGVRRASSLRANALLSSRDEVAAALDGAGIAWGSVPWYEDAFVIEDAGEKTLWDLPLYEQGKVYLQSLSSMLPPLVLLSDVRTGGAGGAGDACAASTARGAGGLSTGGKRSACAQSGLDVLDMCAAPGGKTTQMAALGGKGVRITACEMHAPRAEKLEYNLRKQGAANVVVMRTDARKLDEFFRFDRILLDAPCSGSGTLRARDPKLRKHFTPQLVQKSCKAQRALLDKALSLLKPGGTLVYSTCSVLACENEDIVRAALKQAGRYGKFRLEPVELPGADVLPLLPTALECTLCVCPTRYYEGFFVAKIVRRA
ncbi:MAG: RsmB/NOP family class I SAM-dependent RNA methyltransferase [Eggerthellaceae bacterium]|nr:RsmB/NOP family class I SAM-dependent RNA methyltransferase [Eggerthellaceae bacterium]